MVVYKVVNLCRAHANIGHSLCNPSHYTADFRGLSGYSSVPRGYKGVRNSPDQGRPCPAPFLPATIGRKAWSTGSKNGLESRYYRAKSGSTR